MTTRRSDPEDLLPLGASRFGSATTGSKGLPVIGVTAMPQVGSTEFSLSCGYVPPMSSRGYLVVGSAALAGRTKVGGASLWVDPGKPMLVIPVLIG